MHNKWFAIANPKSRSGKSEGLLNRVEAMLSKNQIEFELHKTSVSGDEIILVEKATSLGYRKILCIGGDGTIQKIVAGIQIQKNIPKENILFGLVPVSYTHLTLPTNREV